MAAEIVQSRARDLQRDVSANQALFRILADENIELEHAVAGLTSFP